MFSKPSQEFLCGILSYKECRRSKTRNCNIAVLKDGYTITIFVYCKIWHHESNHSTLFFVPDRSFCYRVLIQNRLTDLIPRLHHRK